MLLTVACHNLCFAIGSNGDLPLVRDDLQAQVNLCGNDDVPDGDATVNAKAIAVGNTLGPSDSGQRAAKRRTCCKIQKDGIVGNFTCIYTDSHLN